jgi:hypothetical protein
MRKQIKKVLRNQSTQEVISILLNTLTIAENGSVSNEKMEITPTLTNSPALIGSISLSKILDPSAILKVNTSMKQ